MIALSKREPLAALYAMPGPEALRKLSSGLRRSGVLPKELDSLERALDRYQRLVTVEFDGKPTLDGAIALWLPDARERVEAANRHLVYRGMAALRGISVDTMFAVGFIAPSVTVPDRCDVLVCSGTLGLRRLIPSAPVRMLSVKHENPVQRFETIDGRPMLHRPLGGLLLEYCSDQMPAMQETTVDEKTVWAVGDDAMGIKDSLDVVFAEVGIGLAFRTPPHGRRMGQALTISQPTREVQVDMFIHQDLWQTLRPECVVYDTVGYGNANFNDHSRDIDRVPLTSRVTELGRGTNAIATPSIPNYRELVNDVVTRRGWNPREFSGYRFASTYPLFGGQYSLIFTAQ